MEKRELTCIGCPMGCALCVTLDHGEVKEITGFTCKRGKEYAAKEVTHPTRIVTSIVRVDCDRTDCMVSVKTRTDIPKEKIFACIREIRDVRVKLPVHIGDVVLENVADTGVDIVATKNME